MRDVRDDLRDFDKARGAVFQALTALDCGHSITARGHIREAYEALQRVRPAQVVDAMTRVLALRHTLHSLASQLDGEAERQATQAPGLAEGEKL